MGNLSVGLTIWPVGARRLQAASHQLAVGVPMFVHFAAKLVTAISSAGNAKGAKDGKRLTGGKCRIQKGLETKAKCHLMKSLRMEIQTCKVLCAAVQALIHATANKCHKCNSNSVSSSCKVGSVKSKPMVQRANHQMEQAADVVETDAIKHNHKTAFRKFVVH